MKLPLILTCIIFVNLFLVGCEKQKEEKQILQENIKVDSIIEKLTPVAFTYPDSTKQEIFAQLMSIQDSVSYYRLYFFLLRCYMAEAKPDSMQHIIKKTISFCNNREKDTLIAELEASAYFQLAQLKHNEEKKDSAIMCNKMAINAMFHSSKKFKKNLPYAYLNLADSYHQKGDYPQAVANSRKALMVADSMQLGISVQCAIYSELARLYIDLKNFPQADDYFNTIETMIDSLPYCDRYSAANSRGYYYFSTKEYEKALLWFKNAIEYTDKDGLEYTKVPVWGNLGEVYLALNQNDSARYYLNKISEFEKLNFITPSTLYYTDMLYVSLYLKENNLGKATSILHKLSENQAKNNPNYIHLNSKRLEEFYDKKGDYKNAYKYRKEVDIYEDSLRNITVQNNIAEIEARYVNDTTLLKRDIVISQQKQEVLQLKSRTTLIVSVFLVIILLIIIVISYIRKKRDLEYSKQLSTIAQLRMESVRNRISPHFVFNTLNALIPALEEHKELSRPVNLLIKSIRGSLLASEKMAIMLKDEIGNYSGQHFRIYGILQFGNFCQRIIP